MRSLTVLFFFIYKKGRFFTSFVYLLLLLCSVLPSDSPATPQRRERRRGRREPMGRAKLEVKYRENSRARRSTYMTRIKGLKKKAGELSLLCGVDVLVASVSPELNTVEFWPEKDTPEFQRIRERYISSVTKNTNKESFVHGSSEQSLTLLQEEEMIAMEIKLKEVNDRLHFLQISSQRQEEEEPLHQTQFMISTPSPEDLLHPAQQPSSSSPSPFQPPFVQFLTSDLADLPIPFMPSNSSLWSHLDDFNPHYQYIF